MASQQPADSPAVYGASVRYSFVGHVKTIVYGACAAHTHHVSVTAVHIDHVPRPDLGIVKLSGSP